MKRYLSLISLLALATANGQTTGAGSAKPKTAAVLTPIELTCEALKNPEGIDVQPPRLSWKLASDVDGSRQTAHRILASSSPEELAADQGDLWDTGKVDSAETLWIKYAGKPLESRDQVWWKVRVWDEEGRESDWSEPASFTMGLLDRSDWQARWIAPPLINPEVPPHFGFMSGPAAKSDEVKWIQIDLGEEQTIDGIRLWGTDPYFFPVGPSIEGAGFPVRFKVEVSSDPSFAKASVLVDRTFEDVPNPKLQPLEIKSPEPLRGRYVRLTATKLFTGWYPADPANKTKTGYLALAEFEVLNEGRNVALQKPGTVSDEADLSLPIMYGYSAARLTDGLTEKDPGSLYHPRPVTQFRKDFTAANPLTRATLYATAMGCYEVSLNGKKVDDSELAPGYQDHPLGLTYQTYDLTEQVRQGENALGILLGDGWHRIGGNRAGSTRIPGYQPGRLDLGRESNWFIGQLELEYKDGTRLVIPSDESWRCFTNGPWRQTSMFDGSAYDSSYETPGWDSPDFANISEWVGPRIKTKEDPMPDLRAQTMPPIREIKTVEPIRVTETKPGVYLYDFGRSIAGVCRMELNGDKGQRVSVRYFEALDANGNPYLGSLAGASHNQDSILLSGKGTQVFQAKFTYHGFRYAEVTGAKPSKIEAVGYASDIDPVFSLETSDPRFNKLYKLITEAYLDNFFGLVIDVSGRDERRPWLGDCLDPQTMAYLFDTTAFTANSAEMIYRATDASAGMPPGMITPHILWHGDVNPWVGKWTDVYPRDVRLTQNPGFAGWADTSVAITWNEWLNHANRAVLENGYASASRFLNLLAKLNPDLVPLSGGYVGTWPGDWLSSGMTIPPGATSWEPKGNKPANADLWASGWWAYSAKLTADMADSLGRTKEAEDFRAMSRSIVAKLLERRGQSDGSLLDGTQSDYALLMGLGLLDPDQEKKAYPHLLKAVENYGNHFSTGTLTTKLLLNVLSRHGDHDLAWKLVMQPSMPSFGPMIDSWAVSMWESVDGWDPKLGFNPNGKGFSHVGFNSIFQWIAAHVVGLRPDPEFPAYQHFFLEPKISPGLNWLNAAYNSPRGRIECNSRLDGRTVTYDVLIPPNTTATFIAPDGNQQELGSGRHEITAKVEMKK